MGSVCRALLVAYLLHRVLLVAYPLCRNVQSFFLPGHLLYVIFIKIATFPPHKLKHWLLRKGKLVSLGGGEQKIRWKE